MLNVIQSEWIKLRTTKSLYWTTALVLVLSLGMAMLMGGVTGSSLTSEEIKKDPEAYAVIASGISPESALTGMTLIGVMIIIIQAVMFVTSEYSSNVSKPTLLATPKRISVPFAKLLVYGVFATVLSFITSILCMFVMRWALSWNIKEDKLLEPMDFNGDAWTTIFRLCLKIFLVVALSIGVGYLLRHTAGSIALLLLWPLLVEGILIGLLPKVKDWLPPYMPFGNIDAAVGLRDVSDAPWGQIGSMLYFAAWAVVVFAAGVIVLKRRDA